jgi:hypothetical protein
MLGLSSRSSSIGRPLAAFPPASGRHAGLVRIVFEETGGETESQLPRKLARREARVEQLRRQRQAVGGVLADVRQAHLRQINRRETLVAALLVFDP